MKIAHVSYAGYDCIQLHNEAISLWAIQSAGPRIIGLSLPGQANILAEIPGVTAPAPGGGIYQFRGGHRLWHAPEDPNRTYVPDDDPPAWRALDDGLVLTQPVEPSTAIEKQMRISLPDNRARVIIDHSLTNHGAWPIELAPWAITQLKPGGLGILPQPGTPTGLLPNRRLALWPYTQINSTHIRWGDRFIFVGAALRDERLKIGWANPAGWLAYAVDNTLFVKETAYQAEGDYYDYGSSSECYCDDNFIELETLGPRVTLNPGESTTHREIWSLYSGISAPTSEDETAELVERLSL